MSAETRAVRRSLLIDKLQSLKEQRDFINHPLLNQHYTFLIRDIEAEMVGVAHKLFLLSQEDKDRT